MKLLIITAVQEFENKIKKILLKSGTRVFSYMPATGYKDMAENMEENWFGGGMHENESVIFMAFVPTENENLVYDKVKAFNNNDEFTSRIHVATVDLDRTI